MPTGNVKWFDTKKGYGFIIGDGGQDVFVHYTSIIGDGFRSLKDGEPVDYELTQSDKGLQARNVRRLSTDGQLPTAAPKAVSTGPEAAGQTLIPPAAAGGIVPPAPGP